MGGTVNARDGEHPPQIRISNKSMRFDDEPEVGQVRGVWAVVDILCAGSRSSGAHPPVRVGRALGVLDRKTEDDLFIVTANADTGGSSQSFTPDGHKISKQDQKQEMAELIQFALDGSVHELAPALARGVTVLRFRCSSCALNEEVRLDRAQVMAEHIVHFQPPHEGASRYSSQFGPLPLWVVTAIELSSMRR